MDVTQMVSQRLLDGIQWLDLEHSEVDIYLPSSIYLLSSLAEELKDEQGLTEILCAGFPKAGRVGWWILLLNRK
jgi:hypothetical protein